MSGETSPNQAPPLEPYNLFTADPVLASAVDREGAGASQASLVAFGARVGSEEVFEWASEANRHAPELRSHDRFGNRIDEVVYHPAYHALLDLSVSEGLHCSHHDGGGGDGAYVARMARMYLMSQVEVGHGCPISMTGAALGALAHQPELAAVWEPRLRTRTYDPRLVDPNGKAGCLLGMGMTERQGGSDVRANVTVAEPVDGGGPGGLHRLTGHKWFTSAPMCDGFLVLANAPKGLSCFLVPRILPGGERNPLHFMRLKDKLGNRSNASGELELARTTGWMVGDEGRGVPTIIDMVNATRLDCTTWAVSLMRQAVAQAGWHVANRSAFGARLIDKPLMQNVMADLEIEVEAATLMMMRVAGAYERAPIDPDERALARLGTAVAKYWLTKRSSPVVREALECVGGNGYVEESILPRLYREVPLNAIWEGAGNVIALDVLRALSRSPQSLDAFLAELERTAGDHPGLDRACDELRSRIAGPVDEGGARRLVESLAVCWAGSLLVANGDTDVAEAYVRSRLEGHWGSELGTLVPDESTARIARRSVPAV